MYKVEVDSVDAYAFKAKSGGFELLIDAKGSAMSPLDVFLASLGSCIGVYIRKYAEGAKLALKDYSISLQAEFTKEPPICFKEINVSVDLKGAQLDERRKEAIIGFIRNCPVHNTLKLNPEVKVKLI